MRRSLLLASVTLALPMMAGGQSIVYNNTTHSQNANFPLLPEFYTDSAEAGDEIWLAGSAREIVQLKLLFWDRSVESTTIDLKVCFYAVDGFEESPGTTLYEGPLIQNATSNPGMNEYVFDIPHIVVPDRFVWSVQALNRQGSLEHELGPMYYSPATVGWSDDFFWLRQGTSSWNAYNWGGFPVASFAATVTAVPEPATMLAVLVGLAALARKRGS